MDKLSLLNFNSVMPVIKMLLILIIGHFAVKYILKLIQKALTKSNVDISLSRFCIKATNIILHILIILSALNSIGISTTGILAAFSAAAIAVSLALKDSLSNVAGGILLLISPRFVTGDYISAGGREGNVLGVDLLHTKIRTLDGKIVNIPNGVLINEYIINFSKEPRRRVDIVFPIAYEADVELAKKVAMEVMSENKMVLLEPEPPFARISGYSDSSVNLLIRAWCDTPNYWSVHFDLTEKIRKELGAKGIEIPFNQLDVHIKNENN